MPNQQRLLIDVVAYASPWDHPGDRGAPPGRPPDQSKSWSNEKVTNKSGQVCFGDEKITTTPRGLTTALQIFEL